MVDGQSEVKDVDPARNGIFQRKGFTGTLYTIYTYHELRSVSRRDSTYHIGRSLLSSLQY